MKQRIRSIRDRLMRGNAVLFSLPLLGDMTVNEVHSSLLGLTLGGLLSGLFLSGFPAYAVGLSGLLCLFSLVGGPFCRSLDEKDDRYRSVGVATISYEPWYFITLFGLSAVLVLVLSGVSIA